MNRRDLLRMGVATGIVVPAERFVRRFFPVGIDLRKPAYAATKLKVSGLYGDGSFTAYSDQGWVMPVVEGDVLTVTFDTTGLASGVHMGYVTVVGSAASNAIVPVHLNVETRKRPKPRLFL